MKKFRLFVLIVIMVTLATGFLPANAQEDNIENYIINAKDFTVESGFEISSDNQLCSGGNTSFASYDISLRTKAEAVVLTAVHSGNEDGNITVLSFNGVNKSLVANPGNGNTNTEITFTDVKPDSYKIELTGKKAGHKIDYIKVYVRYYKDWENSIVKSDSSIENLDVYDIPERVEGSYYLEAENMTINEPMTIVEDDEASGGAYLRGPDESEKEPAVLDPDADKRELATAKFYVPENDEYYVWIRFNTPDGLKKSTWVGIDNKNYYKFDDSNFLNKWFWSKLPISRYLEKGYHTFNVKHRQGGQKIDAFIITNDNGFYAAGLGSLPGEEYIHVGDSVNEIKVVEGRKNMPGLIVNGIEFKTDADTVINEHGIFAAATTFSSAIGLNLEQYDDFYMMRYGRKYIKWQKDGESVVINGKEIKTDFAPYMFEGVIPMIQVELVKDAFGGFFEYCSEDNTLYGWCDFEEECREALEGEIIATARMVDGEIIVPCDDRDTDIEIWIKMDFENDIWDKNMYYTLQQFDYKDQTTAARGSTWNNNYKGMRDSTGYFTWRKINGIKYEDGAFRACVTDIVEWRVYQVKVKLTKNGISDTFVMKNALRPTNLNQNITPQEAKYNTNGELLLVPTFENIGYYFDYKADNIDYKVKYKKSNESKWKNAYIPYYDKVTEQIRGSIVGLEDDTEYDVCIRLYSKSGRLIKEKKAAVRTWSDTPKIKTTLTLDDVYSGEGTLTLYDIQGTEDGWIKIDCQGKRIDAGYNDNEAVRIFNCKYVIFENAVITGGNRYGIYVGGESNHVRVSNCDISAWSRQGYLDERFCNYLYDGNGRNMEGGIVLMDTENIVVERCYIHDPNVRTNAWTGTAWNNVHPAGGSAITLRNNRGLVLRYNDFIGSEFCRFNDVVEGHGNGVRAKVGTGSDSDVYGNMFFCSEDDSIELDGGQMNVRVYNNRMEKSLCGISTAPNMSGPSYIFRNVITNMSASNNNESGTVIKTGNSPDNINGVQYVFHNTFDTNTHIIRNVNYSGDEYHGITRNNIAVSRTRKTGIANNRLLDERDSNDYDLIFGSVNVRKGDESHAIRNILPEYRDMTARDFNLTNKSAGIDKGEILDNFSDGFVGAFPDMGAYEFGGDEGIIPKRPSGMTADVNGIELVDGIPSYINIKLSDDAEGKNISVLSSINDKWLTAEVCEQIGNNVKIKLCADMKNHSLDEGNAMVIIRLSDGFSIPVTVYCKKIR